MKKIISLILSISMIFGILTSVSLSAFADAVSGTTTDGFTYEQIGNNMTITGHTNPVGELDFPEMVGGYYVDAIAPEAFMGCEGLTGVSIPHLYVMGDRAFKDCTSLENIYFDGAMVYDFGADVFTNTAYYNNHDNWYDDVALYICDVLVKVDEGTIGNFEVYEGCWGIAAEAFKSTGVNEVTIPTTLTAIGRDAFKDTPLSHLYINMTEWMWQNVYIGYPNEELMSAAQQAAPNDFECDHPNADSTYNEPTCTTGGYVLYNCMDCGQSWEDNYEAPLGHNYANLGPNYANDRCTVCGVEDNGHRCDFEVRVYPANCIRRGYTEYVCSCGIEYKMDLVWPYGHEYENGMCIRCGLTQACEHSSWTQNIVEPTCTEQGYTYYTCFDCGEYMHEANYTDPLGHDYVKGSCTRCGEVADHVCEYTETIITPDCTNQGYTEYVCECGNSYILDDSYTDALGHNYIDGVCDRCKEADPDNDAHVCEYKENVIAPTCTEMGYTQMVCECGTNYILDQSYTEKIPHSVSHNGVCSGCGLGVETPHPYESDSRIEWKIGAEDATSILLVFSPDCAFEGGFDYLYIIDENGNQIGAYTGTDLASKKLKVAGKYVTLRFWSDGSVEEYGFSLDNLVIYTAETECQHANTEIQNKVDAGCGDGYTGDTVCTECSAVVAKGEKIEGTGHDFENGICKNCNGQFDVSYNVEGLFIAGFSNPVGVLEIPAEIDGEKVVGIDIYAFNGQRGITGIIIPDSVTQIREYAFNYCENLEFVEIPDSVELIGVRAFGACKALKEITIPDGALVYESAFSECESLEKVVFEGNAKLGIGAFEACPNIKSVYVSSVDNWFAMEFANDTSNPVSSEVDLYVGDEILSELVVPEGTETIPDYAFFGNENITSVYIPSSVKEIGKSAFAYCKNLKTVNIPEDLTKIGTEAFRECEALEEITIPSSVKEIESLAFLECYSLSSLTLSEGVEKIGSNAFSYCDIAELTIPDSVKVIESFAFSYCSKLDAVNGGNGLKEVGYGVFEGTDYIHNIDECIDECLYIGNVLIRFSGNTNYQVVTVKDGTVCIAGGAFENYHYIEELILPDSVEYIGERAFANGSIEKVELPDSVKYIGDCAFSNSEISSVSIPNGVSTIEEGTFSYCNNLVKVVIPSNIKVIKDEAFCVCSALEDVVLPDSVRSIGRHVFDDTMLYNTDDNWTDGVLYIGNHLIKCREDKEEYTVKEGAVTIAACAFESNTISKINLPEGLKTIGERAFSNCYNLKEIVIPEGVERIEEFAFSGCSSLSSVTLPISLKYIEQYAFAYNSMTTVYYNGIKEEWELVEIDEGNYSFTEGATFYFAGQQEEHQHDFYQSSSQTADCYNMGYVEYACDCGFSYKAAVVPVLGHNLEVNYVCEPTCTNRGYTEYVCTRCGGTFFMDYTEKIPHNYVEEWRTENGCNDYNNIRYCCTMCENRYEDVIPPEGHSFVTETVEATCTQAGYTTYKCENCEEEYVSDYIPALGHKLVTEQVVATCTSGGYYHRYCEVCDYDITYGRTDALGHSYEAVVVKPTCTEGGYTTYTCKNGCNHSYVEDVTEALGHEYEAVVTEPTCKSEGYTTYTCKNGCNHSYVDDYTDKTDHSYIVVVVKPTCTDGGYTTYTCENCGDVYTDDVTDALGHNYILIESVSADCDTAGYDYYECSTCGDGYRENEVGALGHKYVKTVVEPTCSEGGYTVTECVNGCGYYRTSDYTGPVHKHEGVITEPTCTEQGFTTYTCTACGDVYIANYVDALGHSYNAVITEADCTNGGYTTYTCAVCGDSYKDNETDALGHNYNYVVIAPTETEQGYTLHTCGRCGDSYKDNFTDPVAPKNKINNVAVKPTDIDVTVTWEPRDDVAIYYVRADKPDGTALLTKRIKDTTVSSYTFTGLEYDVEYTFYVYARLTDGSGLTRGNADKFTASLVIGDRVVGLKASAKGRRIHVSWLSHPDADRYYVYVYPKGADHTVSANRVITVNAGTKTSVEIVNAIAPEVDYDIYVNPRINGKYKGIKNALHVTAKIPVSAPNEIEIIGVTPKKVRIKWNAVKNADRYYVRVTTTKGAAVQTFHTPNAYINITGLAENTTYNVEIQVRVPKSSGGYQYSGYGDINKITTSSFGNVDFTAAYVEGQVNLRWNRIEGASQYYIYEIIDGGKKMIASIKNPSITGRSFQATKGQHTYAIIIRVVNNSASCNTDLILSETITVK